MTADQIAFANSLETPEQRVEFLKSLVRKPEQAEIRSRYDALRWGDGWMLHAKRLEAQNARMHMLLMCAEIHERASDTLREYAEAELARLKPDVPSGSR